jgi:glutaredoxin
METVSRSRRRDAEPAALFRETAEISQKGLTFEDRDIAQDPGALADLKRLGYVTTPVIVIDGNVIVGFDSAKIDKHLVDSNTLGV